VKEYLQSFKFDNILVPGMREPMLKMRDEIEHFARRC